MGILVFLVAFALFLPHAIGIPRGVADDYFRIASQILAGHRMDLGRSPLYPSFIAAMESTRLLSPGQATIAAQAGLCGLSASLAYGLAAALGSPPAGLIAAALLVLNLPLHRACGSLGVEAVFSFLVLNAAVQAVRWIQQPSAGRALLFAASFGFCLSCRSTLAFLPLFLVFWHGPRSIRATWVWPFLFGFLALLPWAAHNAKLYGRFNPFESAGAPATAVYAASRGDVLWVGEGAELRDQARRLFPETRRMETDAFQRHLYALALYFIAANPAAYLWSCLKRLLLWLSYAPLLYLALAAARFRGRWDARFHALASLPVYMALVHMPMATSMRFVVPCVAPLCAIAGCYCGALLSRDPAAPAPTGGTDGRALEIPALFAFLIAAAMYAVQAAVVVGETLRF